MNPDQPSREQIEARLTALLLGELPAAEAELLRWSIARDPELQKLHDQLKVTVGFVREAMKNPAGAPVERETPLKLSPERRQKLLAHFKTGRPQKSFWLRRIQVSPLIPALAVVAVIALLAAVLLPVFSTASKRSFHASRGQYGADVESDQSLDTTIASIRRNPAKGLPARPESAATRNPQESTPPLARIALPNTGSSQTQSEQNAGPEVYSQSVVGYVNVDLSGSKTLPVIPIAPPSAGAAAPPQVEGQIPPTVAGGAFTVSTQGSAPAPVVVTPIPGSASSQAGEHFAELGPNPATMSAPAVTVNTSSALSSSSASEAAVSETAVSGSVTPQVETRNVLTRGGFGGGGFGPGAIPSNAYADNTYVSSWSANDVNRQLQEQANSLPSGGGTVSFGSAGSQANNPFASRLQSVEPSGNGLQNSLILATNGTPWNAQYFNFPDGFSTNAVAMAQDQNSNVGSIGGGYHSPLGWRQSQGAVIDNDDRLVRVEHAWEAPVHLAHADTGEVTAVLNSTYAPQANGSVASPQAGTPTAISSPEAPMMGDETTISGRQTQMRSTVIQPEVSGFNFTAAPTAVQSSAGEKNGIATPSPATGLGPQQYEMRTSKVDPNTFYAGLQNVSSFSFRSNIDLNTYVASGGGSGGLLYVTTPNPARDVSGLAKQYFSSLGIKLDPPANLFYNDRLGVLFVYATPQDEDRIERAMQALGQSPQQPRQTERGQSYEELKHQLDNEIATRDLLAAKIESDKADSAIPKSALVTVLEPAQAGQSQNLWQRMTGEVESKARIKVEPDTISDVPTLGEGSGSYVPYDPYFLETEVKSIQSDAVLGNVVDTLKLGQAWSKPGESETLSRKDAIALLKSRLDLQAVKNTKEIEIGAKSENPGEAAKIANAVAEAYKQYRSEMQNQTMSNGIQFLDQDLLREDRKVREMQSALQQMQTPVSAGQVVQPSAPSQKNLADNEMIPTGLINFEGVDVNQVLEVYAQMTGRTLLHGSLPPAQIINLKNETPLTRTEAIQTLQQALALHGVAVINVGDKFVKAVPVSEAGAAAEQSDKPLSAPPASVPVPQPEVQTRDNAFSTFSLNVSDVSFKLAAASLGNGRMPAPDSIRSEEFINAFDYHDPEPLQDQPLAFTFERARDPFAQERDFLRFSVKAAAVGRQEGRALNLVLLLDTSGSMERADRVAIIREALRVLSAQLQPQDTVSVVTFARTARLWADGVRGDQAGATLDKVGGITPEGGTNLEEAMRLAYETALRHFIAGGMNRVVLLTDGAANLGNVDPKALTQKVETERRQGIALDCFGVGWDDYNDDLLEQLSSNGDGRYAFINSPDEASTEFAAKLAGALQVAAEDVKVQVEFNPARVAAWRQIGYAKHQLTKEQFRDNSVAAGAIASREAGNALYVIETRPDGEGPIATVRVRYRMPGTQDNYERSWLVDYSGAMPSLEQSSPAMRLAATAAEFSEWLAHSPFAQDATPDELLNDLSGVPQFYGTDKRPQQLEWMIRQAKSVFGK